MREGPKSPMLETFLAPYCQRPSYFEDQWFCAKPKLSCLETEVQTA